MAAGSLRAGRAPVTMRVPFKASSVAVVRRRLRAWMADGVTAGDVGYDARVVLSELVANSVRHAKPLADGTLEVTWHLDARGIEMAVTDGGAITRPRKLRASSSALGGRGMTIVEALALSWWAEQGRSRSTVHAVLALR